MHGAEIPNKLLYGLESASLTGAEYERLDAFQIKALKTKLGITHSYQSHVSNAVVMETTNLNIRLKGGKTITITRMSEKLISKQIRFRRI